MGIFSFFFSRRPTVTTERGTIVFRSPAQKIVDVGEMAITSSVVMKEFTEQETRENAKDDLWFYEPAFKQVTQTIEAEPKQISAMFEPLTIAFSSGNPARALEIVEQFLPEGTWRWPAYEEFARERDKEDRDEEIEYLTTATLAELISNLKVDRLRSLHKEFAGERAKSPGRGKAAIAAALFDTLHEDQKITLTEKLRHDAIAKVRLPDYRDMVEILTRRISMVAYGIRHKSQLKEVIDMFPLWKFTSVYKSDMPEQCRKRDGKRYRHDNAIWNKLAPCDYLDCSCRIRSCDTE